jgi:hypothetical protein
VPASPSTLAATIVNLSLSINFLLSVTSFVLALLPWLRTSSAEVQTTEYPSNGFCMRPECVIHVVVALMA